MFYYTRSLNRTSGIFERHLFRTFFLKGCHFCIQPVQEKTFCGKTTFWQTSNVLSFLDFERKQSEICNEKSANFLKLHSTRPAEKIEEKNGKFYTILQFSDFQQENVETLGGELSAALLKLRVCWSEETFKGKIVFRGTNTISNNHLDLSIKRSDS